MAGEGDISVVLSQEVPNLDWFEYRDTLELDEQKPHPPRSLEALSQLWDHTYENSLNLIPNKSELLRTVLNDPERLKWQQEGTQRKASILHFAKKAHKLGYRGLTWTKLLKAVFKPTHLHEARAELKDLAGFFDKVAKTKEEREDPLDHIYAVAQKSSEAVYNMVTRAKTATEVTVLAQAFMKDHDTRHKVSQAPVRTVTQKDRAIPVYIQDPAASDRSVNYNYLLARVAALINKQVPLTKIYARLAENQALLSSTRRAKIIDAACDKLPKIHISVFKGVRKSPKLFTIARKNLAKGKIYPIQKQAAPVLPDAEKITAEYENTFQTQDFDPTSLTKTEADSFQPTDVTFGGMIL